MSAVASFVKAGQMRVLAAKTGLPPDVRAKLVSFVKTVSDDADFKSYVAKQSLFSDYRDPAAVNKLLAAQMASITKEVAAGIGAK